MSGPAKKAPAASAPEETPAAPAPRSPAPAPKPTVFIASKGFAFTRNYALITIHAGQLITDHRLAEDIKKNGGELVEVDPDLLVKCPHCARLFVHQKKAG